MDMIDCLECVLENIEEYNTLQLLELIEFALEEIKKREV